MRLEESLGERALRDVHDAWDDLLDRRSVQLAVLVTGIVQQLSALRHVSELPDDERTARRGEEFSVDRTVKRMMHAVMAHGDHNLRVHPADYAVEVGTIAACPVGHVQGLSTVGGGEALEQVRGRDSRGAGDGTAAREGVEQHTRALWSAEIESEVKGMGLLEPLLQCCAVESS